MTKKEQEAIKNQLSGLFGVIKKVNNSDVDVICFDTDYMNPANKNYSIYKIVSAVMQSSGLSHNFSYEVASRAVSVLAECQDINNDNELQEAIDSACPIYTNEIMTIYMYDHNAVDEAVAEMGSGKDSEHNAKLAWYLEIQKMVFAIKNKLTE